MRDRLALAAIAFAIPLATADTALACSCVPVNAREQVKASDGASWAV